MACPEDGADLQVREAAVQASLRCHALEKGLEHRQAGGEGQLLILESDLRDRVGFPMAILPANTSMLTATYPTLKTGLECRDLGADHSSRRDRGQSHPVPRAQINVGREVQHTPQAA